MGDSIIEEKGFIRRVLKLDNEQDVCVDIFAPVEEQGTNGDYSCGYRITGLPKTLSSFGMGIDSIQALYITLLLVRNRLYSTEEFKAGRLSWIGSLNANDLGFPMEPE